MRKRWIAAIVVAFIAGGGGGALAASRYLITSESQISPKVLKELRGARGPAGPPGRAGTRGPAGATGATGAAGALGLANATIIYGPVADVNTSVQSASSTALCPVGDFVVSGGFYDIIGDMTTGTSMPAEVNGQAGWYVVAGLNSVGYADGDSYSFQAVADCVAS